MKHIKIIMFLCGIFVIMAFSCKKESDPKEILWELPLNGDKTAIVNQVNDIEFKFCLLNADGEPTTSFNERENFSFYFAMSNNRTNDSLHLDNSFLSKENGFCKVLAEDGTIIGLPFIFTGTELIGSGAHPFYGNNTKYELTVPWQDNRDEWNTLHCYFKSTHQNFLPKGKYYSTFKHQFCFHRKVDEPTLCTDIITFKLNFEIK